VARGTRPTARPAPQRCPRLVPPPGRAHVGRLLRDGAPHFASADGPRRAAAAPPLVSSDPLAWTETVHCGSPKKDNNNNPSTQFLPHCEARAGGPRGGAQRDRAQRAYYTRTGPRREPDSVRILFSVLFSLVPVLSWCEPCAGGLSPPGDFGPWAPNLLLNERTRTNARNEQTDERTHAMNEHTRMNERTFLSPSQTPYHHRAALSVAVVEYQTPLLQVPSVRASLQEDDGLE